MARNPALRIYDSPGQVLACCFDPTKALCRRDTPAPSAIATPDLTSCDSRCANIARTDTHIEALRGEVELLHEVAVIAEDVIGDTKRAIGYYEAIVGIDATHVPALDGLRSTARRCDGPAGEGTQVTHRAAIISRIRSISRCWVWMIDRASSTVGG